MRRIATHQSRKIATLQACRYFQDVNDAILGEISQGMQLCCFEGGEAVFWEGETSKGLYIIEQGSVRLYKTSLQGRELVLQVFGEGESFNEVPVFDRETNPVNVAALEDSLIWIVDAVAIRACLDKYPEVTKAIILNLSKNLRMLVEKVEELSFFQVTNRLARLLARLPDEQLMGQTDLRLTRDELAARLGTVREVVVRSLRELERSGAIQVSRTKIEIVDDARLQDWIEAPNL